MEKKMNDEQWMELAKEQGVLMMKCMTREGRPIYEPPVFNYERFQP